MTDFFLDFLGTVFSVVFSWILGPFLDLSSFETLVLGKENDLVYSTFTTNQINNIYEPGVNTIALLAGTVFVAAIVLWGVRITHAGNNPMKRSAAIQTFIDIIIVVLCLLNLDLLYSIVLDVNSSIVSFFGSAIDTNMSDTGHGLKDLVTNVSDAVKSDGVLGAIIISLVKLGLAIWANVYYITRTFTLLILMILGPFMLIMYLFPATKNITLTWGGEFIGTVFVQSIHALLLWIVVLMDQGEGGLISIMLYMVFIPVGEAIKGLFGLTTNTQGVLSQTASMMGASTLAGLYGSAKGALDGRSPMAAIRGGIQGSKENANGKDFDEKGASFNAIEGSTVGADKMFKASQFASMAGKAVGGMSGTFVGSPMGPIGAIAGAGIGSALGGTTAGFATRAGMTGISLAKDRIGKGLETAKENYANSLDGTDKLVDDITDKKTSAWASANKTAFANRLKENHPDISDKAIDKQWEKEVSAQRSAIRSDVASSIGNISKDASDVGKVSDLAAATKSSLMNNWEAKNKQDFFDNYDSSSGIPVEQAWEDKKAAQSKVFDSAINKVAANTTSGAYSAGGHIPSAFTNKKDFINNVANELNPNGSRTEQESLKNAMSDVSSSVANPYLRGDGKGLNKEYVASQMAQVKTAQAKETFMKEQGGTEEQWNKQASSVYQQNYSDAEKTLDGIKTQEIKMKPGLLKNAAAISTGVIAGGVRSTGIVGAARTLYDSEKVRGLQGIGTSVVNGTLTQDVAEAAHSHSNPIMKAVSGVKAGADSISASYSAGKATALKVDDAMQKHATLRDGVSRAAGIFGVNAYNSASKYMQRNGIYSNAASVQVLEISDINAIAPKVIDPKTGMESIAAGSVRMATTRGQSIIQVRDHLGEYHDVSKQYRGDVGLKNNEIVYQDLDINNGVMKPMGDSYLLDSSGSKQLRQTSYVPNVQKMVGNRNLTNVPPRKLKVHNQAVDHGTFSRENLAESGLTNITLCVENSRSYLLANNINNEAVRVSPFYEGDARLAEGQVALSNCTVEKTLNTKFGRTNFEIKQGDFYVGGNDNATYTSTINANNFLPSSENKRNAQRRQLDTMRYKQGLGGMF